jgi:hypothetical protein
MRRCCRKAFMTFPKNSRRRPRKLPASFLLVRNADRTHFLDGPGPREAVGGHGEVHHGGMFTVGSLFPRLISKGISCVFPVTSAF